MGKIIVTITLINISIYFMEQTEQNKLTCPLCRGTEFDEEKGRLESQWGMTEHKADMFICKKCKYIMLFGQGRTWWAVE